MKEQDKEKLQAYFEILKFHFECIYEAQNSDEIDFHIKKADILTNKICSILFNEG